MSDLMTKARNLMQATGCSLSEAAKALKDASEDYDLALALLMEKRGNKNGAKVNEVPSAPTSTPAPTTAAPTSKPANEEPRVETTTNVVEPKPAPTAQTNQTVSAAPVFKAPTNNSRPVQPTNPSINTNRSNSSANILGMTFGAMKSLNLFPIIIGVFLVLGALTTVFVYFIFIIEGIFEQGDGTALIASGISSFILGVFFIIYGIKLKRKIVNNKDDLNYIKSRCPTVPDNVIFMIYNTKKGNVEETVKALSDNAYLSRVEKLNSTHIGDGAVVGAALTSGITAVSWCAAAMSYFPEEQEGFETPQIIGVIAAFLFLIISISLIANLKRRKDITYRKFGMWTSILLLLFGALVPLVFADRYFAFIGTLIGYILGIFVVLVILNLIFGKLKSSGKSYNEPKKKSFFDKPEKPKKTFGYMNTSQYDANGKYRGKTYEDGTMYDENGHYIGKIYEDGTIYDANGHYNGKIYDDGTIYDANGHYKGKVYEDGTVYDSDGHNVGRNS